MTSTTKNDHAVRSIVILAILILFNLTGCSQNNKGETIKKQQTTMDVKLKISFGEVELIASLYDNATTRDFISRLPITTTLEDYADNEKIFYPEQKLSTKDAPDGYNPSKGDITYYAPWGDVAIFYKDFKYSPGLISIGSIDGSGIEQLKNAGDFPVTFELIE